MTELSNVLWMGGAQWAGKTTVARLLAARYPIVVYHYDYHDARSHSDRVRADPSRYPESAASLEALDNDPSSVWVHQTPVDMADTARRIHAERLPMVLDDIRAMPDGATVLAEGWGLRPALIAPLIGQRERAVFVVPTDAFRQHQLATLPRAQRLSASGLSDPERGQLNRLERDSILAREVVTEARQLGLRVIEVDGSLDEAEVADLVEKQLRPFLPRWLY